MRRFPLTFSIYLLTAALLGGCGDSGSNVSFGGVQDIGQFREVLNKGELPGEQTLDANGFFNEHHIELPPAACGDDLCLHGLLAVHRDWLWSEYQAVLQVNFSSPIDASTLPRPPLSLVAVIDTSASMKDDEKIDRVREGLDLLIDGLLPGDRLGIVSYGTEAKVLADVSADADPAALHAAVDDLKPEGSTNFYDGLSTGLEMISAAFDAQRQNRVILISDGVPTRGITDVPEILKMAEPYVAKGIPVTSVGVGFDYDSFLMKQLALESGGSFYYIEDAAAVKEIFTDEIRTFLTPIATDLDIDVTAGPSYEIGEVLGATGWTIEKSSSHIHIPAVFLASRSGEGGAGGGGGEGGGNSSDGDPDGRRGGGSALFLSMIPAIGTIDVESRVGHIAMTFHKAGTGELVEQSIDAVSPFPAGVAGEEPFFSHESMAKSYAMYNMFLGLRTASRNAYCDIDCARWSLVRLRDQAELWNAETNDQDIAADVDLDEQFIGNIDAIRRQYHWDDPVPPPDQKSCSACRNGGCCPGDNACSLAAEGTKNTSEPTRPATALLALFPLALAARAAARRWRREE